MAVFADERRAPPPPRAGRLARVRPHDAPTRARRCRLHGRLRDLCEFVALAVVENQRPNAARAERDVARHRPRAGGSTEGRRRPGRAHRGGALARRRATNAPVRAHTLRAGLAYVTESASEEGAAQRGLRARFTMTLVPSGRAGPPH